ARRLSDIGPRAGKSEKDYYRFVVGLEGDLSNDWHWDVSYNFGRTKTSDTGSGQPNFPNLRQALAVIEGPDGPMCADPQARAQGCLPINFFGENTVDPAAIPFIAADQSFTTRITQQVASANLSGSVLELPAGPLGFAIGA